jgi:hypothetical protein
MAHTNCRCDYSLYNLEEMFTKINPFVPFKAHSVFEMPLNAVFLPELAEDFLLTLIPQSRSEAIAVGKIAGAI